MAQTIFGTDYAVTALNRAFNNTSPANAVFQSQKSSAGTTPEQNYAFARQFGSQFNNISNADLAKKVMTNMGALPSTDADVLAFEEALTDYFAGVAIADRGIVVLQLSQLLSGLETATGAQAVYADAAKAWNKEVEQSFIYSSNPSNTGPSNPGDGPGGNQSAFVLTTGVDNIKSSATEKTVVGIIDTNNSVSTLNAGDVISGTGVDGDTLRVIMTAGTAYPGSATITDIDRIEVQAATAAQFVATGVTGAKELISRDSTAAVTFNNINSLATAVGIQNSTQDLIANWEPALLNGKTDAVTLVLDNATGGKTQNVTLSTGIEVLSVKAVGTASDVGSVDTVAANPNFKTMNIAADVALRIRDVSDTVTTIDASASTAGVRLEGFGAGTEMTITGGSGNDRFTFAQDQFTAKDKIVGGDGVDRLDLSLNNTLAAKNQISGIENISVVAAKSATLNLAGNTDIQTMTVREGGVAANVITVTNVEAPLANVVYEGSAITAGATASAVQNFNNLTVNLAVGKGTGTNDSTAVSVSNGGLALDALQNHAFNLGTLTLNGIENVSLTVADGKSNLTLADTALKSLTVTSTSDVLFNAALNSTGLTTVDGTGVAGKLTVNTATSDTSVTVTLGNGNNDVTFGDGVGGKGNTDVITSIILGTGSNVVREENVDVTTGGTVARNGYAVVSNFDAGVGGDAFGFSAHVASALNQANYIKQLGTGAAIAAAAVGTPVRKLIVLEDTAANGFSVTANDENTIVSDFKAWTSGAGVTWDNNLVAQDSDSVVAVNGNDGNTYLFRLDNLDNVAGIQTGAGDVIELVAVLNNVNATNLVLNNFVF